MTRREFSTIVAALGKYMLTRPMPDLVVSIDVNNDSSGR